MHVKWLFHDFIAKPSCIEHPTNTKQKTRRKPHGLAFCYGWVLDKAYKFVYVGIMLRVMRWIKTWPAIAKRI